MRQFSPQHLAALAVLLLTASASVWAARHHPGRWQAVFSGALAALIFAAWAGAYVADAVLGAWAVKYTLPLQLTDAVSAVATAALGLLMLWVLDAMTNRIRVMIDPRVLR